MKRQNFARLGQIKLGTKHIFKLDILILVLSSVYRHLQHGGSRRYAVGYPVQMQEHAADSRLEAHAFGRALGGGRCERRQEHQQQK